MEIERLEIPPRFSHRDTGPISLGLNLGKKSGLTHVNLFALEDNSGDLVSDNLWRTAQFVCREVLSSVPIDSVAWSLSSHHQTTAIAFSMVDAKPLRIDLSNKHALDFERCSRSMPGGLHAASIEKYREMYDGAPPVYQNRDRGLTLGPTPMTVFTSPCSHPAAKDGMFHCMPSYFDSPHMQDQYGYMLVDTDKVLKGLARHDPQMLKHAAYKLAGSSGGEWLKSTSMEHPRDMGHWVPTRDQQALTMCSGMADLIKVVEELRVPYFPVAIQKSWDPEILHRMQSAVGYQAGGGHAPVILKPVFSPRDFHPGF